MNHGAPSAPTKLLDAQSVPRVVDQRRQPPLSSLLTLRAGHPTRRLPAVSGRLLLVELPRARCLLEPGDHPVRQRSVHFGCRVAAVGVHILEGEGREQREGDLSDGNRNRYKGTVEK